MKIGQFLRALVALGVGIFITFSQDHSAALGLIAIVIFSLATAVVTTVEAFAIKGSAKIETIPAIVLGIVIGSLGLMVTENQTQAFVLLVAAWGILAGSFELYQARSVGLKTQNGRDYLISAVFSLVLGALFIINPLDIVSMVGFFGAFAVMSGVHLGIAAFTPGK